MPDNENIPIDWDYSSTSGRARFLTVPSADGPVIDGAPLGDRFIVFQSAAISVMEFIGGNQVFGIRRLFGYGIINKNARCEFDGRQLVVARTGIILHDGATMSRPADNKVETRFFAELTNPDGVYCYADEQLHEASICYPAGTPTANKRLVFNFQENTWTFDSFGTEVSRIDRGYAPASVPTWASIKGRWVDINRSWASLGVPTRELATLQSRGQIIDRRGGIYLRSTGDSNDVLWRADDASGALIEITPASGRHIIFRNSPQDDYDAYVERHAIDLDELTGNSALVKFIRAVYLMVTGTGQFNIQFGVMDTPRGPIRWDRIRTINLGTDRHMAKFDFRKTGRFFAYRMGSWDGAHLAGSWRVSGMDLDIELMGYR